MWLAGVEEARKSGTTRFPLPTLLLLGTFMFVTHSGSRNLFNGMLRDSGALGRTLSDILGAGPDALPHLDTLENGGFALEHVYSHNENASKCYVMLMLLAHVVQQLVTRGRLGAVFAGAMETFKAYGKRMLAALLNIPLDPGRAPPGQIRLSTA